MLSDLSWIDGLVFGVILLLTYGAVIYGKYHLKQSSSPSPLQVILLGRALTLPLFVATLVATWYGGVLGVTQIAYESGVFNFVTQGVFWYISYLGFAFWIAPRIRQTQAMTLPELVHMKFGPRAEIIASIFNIANVLPTAYILSLGLIIHTLFDTSIAVGAALGVIIVLSYSLTSGLRSIIFSDLIQFFVMIIAVYAVFIISWQTYGGLSFLRSHLPTTHFKLTGDQSIATLIVWGLIAMSTLVDPNFYHRIFAAASDKVARIGLVISTIIWALFDLATTAGGMYAAAVARSHAHHNDLETDSRIAYLSYALDLLPHGLKGLFIAGLVASILSTLDSYLFLAATTIGYDIQKKRRRFLRSYWRNLLICAAISYGLSLLFASDLPGAHGIRHIWKIFGGYSAGCLLLPVLIGIFSKRTYPEITFLISTITSVTVMTIWRFLWLPQLNSYINSASSMAWITEIDALYIGLFCSAVVFMTARPWSPLQSESSLTQA